MSRTSKREVQAVFERLCQTVGVPVGGEFDRETRTMSRGWVLDANPTYGGYIIRGYDGNGTGQSSPMGEYRRPAGEFVSAMHFAIRAVAAAHEQS